MQNIYDNGEICLGEVKKIIEYFNTTELDIEEYEDLLEELKKLNDNDIVAINYDHGNYLGYSTDYWTKEDKKQAVYDNGTQVLGTIYDIKEYICKNFNEDKEIIEEEIIKPLEKYDANIVVMINFNAEVGYTIDYWTTKDIITQKEV